MPSNPSIIRYTFPPPLHATNLTASKQAIGEIMAVTMAGMYQLHAPGQSKSAGATAISVRSETAEELRSR